MADELARARLARAADRLNRTAHPKLPSLILLTDDERLPDPRAAIASLPRGSLVIVRSRNRAGRVELARMLPALARANRLKWIIAEDAGLAEKLGANGVHFPEQLCGLAAHWRALRPHWLITCSAHSLRACLRAAAAGADAVLLAPVFSTPSHAERPALGPMRTRRIVGQFPLPVYALGGVDAQSAKRLAFAPLAGLAAIGALKAERT